VQDRTVTVTLGKVGLTLAMDQVRPPIMESRD